MYNFYGSTQIVFSTRLRGVGVVVGTFHAMRDISHVGHVSLHYCALVHLALHVGTPSTAIRPWLGILVPKVLEICLPNINIETIYYLELVQC